MPLVAFSNFTDILSNLPIENIESTILLNLMSPVDILLYSFFVLVDFVLYLFLFIDNFFFSSVYLCLYGSCSSFCLRVN